MKGLVPFYILSVTPDYIYCYIHCVDYKAALSVRWESCESSGYTRAFDLDHTYKYVYVACMQAHMYGS